MYLDAVIAPDDRVAAFATGPGRRATRGGGLALALACDVCTPANPGERLVSPVRDDSASDAREVADDPAAIHAVAQRLRDDDPVDVREERERTAFVDPVRWRNS